MERLRDWLEYNLGGYAVVPDMLRTNFASLRHLPENMLAEFKSILASIRSMWGR